MLHILGYLDVSDLLPTSRVSQNTSLAHQPSLALMPKHPGPDNAFFHFGPVHHLTHLNRDCHPP